MPSGPIEGARVDGAGAHRTLAVGKGDSTGTDNAIRTSKYTLLNFLPISIKEQFRRFGNIYFLVMGMLMFFGTYTPLFNSSISPWTTLGPLAFVVSISLIQEGFADLSRHKSDVKTNSHPCVVLRNSQDLEGDSGRKRDASIMKGADLEVSLTRSLSHFDLTSLDGSELDISNRSGEDVTTKVSVAFEEVQRKDIFAGDIVLIRNRDMVPADLILLASSGENGATYIETSPIDGETNLKLRSTPHIPSGAIDSSINVSTVSQSKFETIESAVKRITRFSLLGYPTGISTLKNPNNVDEVEEKEPDTLDHERKGMMNALKTMVSSKKKFEERECSHVDKNTKFVAALTSEPPNASVNTFSGKLTLPPTSSSAPSKTIALGADNILLRGAMLRNTEWAIGVACFTGADTKLVRNSVATPSKFSCLDLLMNRVVIYILCVLIACVLALAGFSTNASSNHFDDLWYASFNKNTAESWPYLPDTFDVPVWNTSTPNYFQMSLTYLTLLNNFVPLSLYVTVEIITVFMMLLISWDKNMYHKDTDTNAIARSTIVTDLGQVQYVFSDKTGTLTQNVMKFKRCSVDGLIFGAPVEKSAPGQNSEINDDMDVSSNAFHSLQRLKIGSVPASRGNEDVEIGLKQHISSCISSSVNVGDPKTMTFNGEMFLRVMSICNTVVVEKEIDASTLGGKKKKKSSTTPLGKFFNRSRNNTATSSGSRRSRANTNDSSRGRLDSLDENQSQTTSVAESASMDMSTLNDVGTPIRSRNDTLESNIETRAGKSSDGSPKGFAYQAESPDEGALVSAASLEYGFQLIGRESDGVIVKCETPSLLADKSISKGLKSGSLTVRDVAFKTASPHVYQKDNETMSDSADDSSENFCTREKWSLLAVNKFDSDRKRMSVLVRSPTELGSIPILFCKGADSSMLDPELNPEARESNQRAEWYASTQLEMQSHLGTFATEGLRTLVLGMRILSEDECESWLADHKAASTAITGRDEKLKTVANKIEKNLHIVGATAIEDKLQDGVPEAIHNIGKAGIKLWVLTGDKRETAIEIGYSTKVLLPEMHLCEVADAKVDHVKALVATEFMKLVKMGKLLEYQRSSLKVSNRCLPTFFSSVGAFFAQSWRGFRKFYHTYIKTLCGTCNTKSSRKSLDLINDEIKLEEFRKHPKIRRQKVRNLAEQILKTHSSSDTTDKVPGVFERANSAKRSISEKRSSAIIDRSLTLAAVTSHNVSNAEAGKSLEEDNLSLLSFVPDSDLNNAKSEFDNRRRTVLEKVFAVDRDVRKGRLVKHLEKSKRVQLKNRLDEPQSAQDSGVGDVQRALVIEGAALAYFLGDELLEEMLFSVAKCCNSVIACRVSPKQKALLVKLVYNYVSPSPVTLAIGDGANDVGMIQEAQVGVGISGLEGQQAVNASDFAIAQFRFLEDLLLIHGRWNFMRMSKVVLFSFYKNACMATILILFSRKTLYSGTVVFDQFLVSTYNFILGWPIIFLGFFDRDLDKDYIKKNPVLYESGPNNEHLSARMVLRWVCLCFLQAATIYFIALSAFEDGGSVTSAFNGLMKYRNKDRPGEGEIGDLTIFGTTLFSCLVFIMGYKVLFESRAILIGRFPALYCPRNSVDGFWSRLGYSWVGIVWLSFIPYFCWLFLHESIGKAGASLLSPFVMVANHLLFTSSKVWMIMFFIPIFGTLFDVIGKVFSNMYFPTQTQIHCEIEHVAKHNSQRGATAEEIVAEFEL